MAHLHCRPNECQEGYFSFSLNMVAADMADITLSMASLHQTAGRQSYLNELRLAQPQLHFYFMIWL